MLAGYFLSQPSTRLKRHLDGNANAHAHRHARADARAYRNLCARAICLAVPKSRSPIAAGRTLDGTSRRAPFCATSADRPDVGMGPDNLQSVLYERKVCIAQLGMAQKWPRRERFLARSGYSADHLRRIPPAIGAGEDARNHCEYPHIAARAVHNRGKVGQMSRPWTAKATC